MYDLIGDIHGHADELQALLEHLGYRKQAGAYRHAERRVIFLGDFVDRGPKIRDVLETVRAMVLEESALAVIGNHEWNALAYHTVAPDYPGGFLRNHGEKNEKQHRQTVLQLDPKSLDLYLDWFRSLPMWLDLEGLRAIHACWDQGAIDMIAPVLAAEGGITERLLRLASRDGDPLFDAVEDILKGKEVDLPEGVSFLDKENHKRKSIRTRWFVSPVGQTYRTYAFQASPVACDDVLSPEKISMAVPYPPTAKPVFIGHYWLNEPHPVLLAPNVACLDFSVAKGGYLCAYRWQGEQTLDARNFVRVPATTSDPE